MLFFAASGQENEPGHEENLLAVEGSGPGGDQHRCVVQLPGAGTAVFDRPGLACRDAGVRWDITESPAQGQQQLIKLI